MKARWLGHRLLADLVISVDPSKSVSEANAIAVALRSELQEHLPAMGGATIQFDDYGIEPVTVAIGHHHAPEPFAVNSPLATGLLEIIDTPEGERMRFSVRKHAPGLEAVVEIDRGDSRVERLPLLASPADHHALISAAAPEEPHEFDAVLKLMAGVEVDDLPFRMVEPEGHQH